MPINSLNHSLTRSERSLRYRARIWPHVTSANVSGRLIQVSQQRQRRRRCYIGSRDSEATGLTGSRRVIVSRWSRQMTWAFPLDVKMFKQQQLLGTVADIWFHQIRDFGAEIGDAVEEATAYTMNNFGGERTMDEKIQRTQSSLLRQFWEALWRSRTSSWADATRASIQDNGSEWISKHRWRHDASSGQDESQGGLSQPQLPVDSMELTSSLSQASVTFGWGGYSYSHHSQQRISAMSMVDCVWFGSWPRPATPSFAAAGSQFGHQSCLPQRFLPHRPQMGRFLRNGGRQLLGGLARHGPAAPSGNTPG